MKAILLLFLISAQDPDFPERSRKFFEAIMGFKAVEGALLAEQTCSDAELKGIVSQGRSDLDVSEFTVRYGRGSMSSSRSGGSGRVQIRMKPSKPYDRVEIVVDSPDRSGSIQIQQSPSGRLRVLYEGPEGLTVVFIQKENRRCTLFVDGKETEHIIRGVHFEAMLLNHPKEVSQYLLRPLERFFAIAPLTAVASDVVEIALSVKPMDEKGSKELGRLLKELNDESPDVRNAAGRSLKQLTAEDGAALHFVVEHMKSTRSLEVRGRLKEILNADARRRDAYQLVIKRGLHRDLDYLIKLLAAGWPVEGRLRALTAASFDSPEAWSKWLKDNKARLRWDAKAWRYEIAGEDE